ncbi:MAG: B12-binding domain-containing radical SAM protein [Deltaproteobacteria bacterium]|nr:B12-binding domain-containing radical SAM protein [Deltaproteobacteria bacterium]
MKVLLTQPRLPTLYQKPKEPPLNLAILAAVLEKEGFTVRCIDMEAHSSRGYLEVLNEFKPHILGLSATTMGVLKASEMALQAKRTVPEIVTIIGGYGMSCDRDYVMGTGHFDYGVIGEGELTLSELSNNIRDGKPCEEVKGLVWRDDGKTIVNEPREPLKDLDSLPRPNFAHFNVHGYGKSLPIFTTRGCPYNCLYCVVNKVGVRGSRAKSAQSVVDEMEYYRDRYHIKVFSVVDDNFSVDKQRAHAMCDLILKRGLNIQFLLGQGIRADNIDRELFFKMKQAGCPIVAMGVETTNPKTMKALRRGIRLERIAESIEDAKAAGLIVKTFNLIGGPHEVYEDIMNTIAFNEEMKVDIPGYGVYQPLPGSDLLEWVKNDEHARLNPGYDPYTWSNPGGDIGPGDIPFETDYFSFEERYKAYKVCLASVNQHLVKGFVDRHLGRFGPLLYPFMLNRPAESMARKLYLKFLRGRIEPWD